jgi:hypothetical protein
VVGDVVADDEHPAAGEGGQQRAEGGELVELSRCAHGLGIIWS